MANSDEFLELQTFKNAIIEHLARTSLGPFAWSKFNEEQRDAAFEMVKQVIREIAKGK